MLNGLLNLKASMKRLPNWSSTLNSTMGVVGCMNNNTPTTQIGSHDWTTSVAIMGWDGRSLFLGSCHDVRDTTRHVVSQSQSHVYLQFQRTMITNLHELFTATF